MITPPQRILQDRLPTKPLIILFRIISRKPWSELQSLHEAFSRHRVEHVLHVLYVLIIELTSVRRLSR